MIEVATLVGRLQQLTPDPFRAVGKASDFDAALDQLKAAPAVFILPSRKLPGPDLMLTGAVTQRVTAQFSAIIGVTRIGADGAAQLDRIEMLERALIHTLHGWQAPGADTPFTYAGGQMIGLDLDKGVMFWGSDFAADYYLRSPEA